MTSTHSTQPPTSTPNDDLEEGRKAEERHQVEPPEMEAAFAALAPGAPARRDALGVAA